MMKFEDNLIINGNELTRKYVESLNYEEREALVDPILKEFREIGFVYPNNEERVRKEYERLLNKKIDVNETEVYNNSSVGTYICKYFCKSFFKGTEMNKGKKAPNMVDLFQNDDVLRKVIRNRLGLDWYKQRGEDDIEAFPISPRQVCFQGFRSKRIVNALSLFKPEIAKFIYEKYSDKNDLVYDYSAGFGGRILGAMSCGRKYIGVDPLTADEVGDMIRFFDWKNCLVIKGCSEDVRLAENSVDLAFSSPPYYNKEVFSDDITQAYNQGQKYFYEVYWTKTLENIKYMLKPGKIFALNIKGFQMMRLLAERKFEYVEEIGMKTVRSHLTKKKGIEKFEYIYIFRNNK